MFQEMRFAFMWTILIEYKRQGQCKCNNQLCAFLKRYCPTPRKRKRLCASSSILCGSTNMMGCDCMRQEVWPDFLSVMLGGAWFNWVFTLRDTKATRIHVCCLYICCSSGTHRVEVLGFLVWSLLLLLYNHVYKFKTN